jgi:hypothetical protein
MPLASRGRDCGGASTGFWGRCGGIARAGDLAPALDHFRKVARSYRPGLFHAANVADLPRTNNALEHLFGSQRYHERRATGRKTASPGAVLRGSARLIAGIGTRAQLRSAYDLGRADHALARSAPLSRPRAAGPDRPHPLPPRSRRLLRRPRTTFLPNRIGRTAFHDKSANCSRLISIHRRKLLARKGLGKSSCKSFLDL